MNNKIIAPIVVVALVAGTFIAITGGKDEQVETTSVSQKVIEASELFKFKGDTEDKGVIRKYSTSAGMTGSGFNITYINEQGKLKNVTLNDIYVIGDVEGFEGATIVVKKLSSETLTNDQINMLAYSIRQEVEEAEKLVDQMINGTAIELGFILEESKEEVVEKDESEEVEEAEEKDEE